MEFLREDSRKINIDNDMALTLMDSEMRNEKVEALLDFDNDDSVLEAEKEELVRSIVKNLPAPCNELLWGFYRDNLSIKSLAEMFNYSSENSVKVIKHRCIEKFRDKYKELCNKLF